MARSKVSARDALLKVQRQREELAAEETKLRESAATELGRVVLECGAETLEPAQFKQLVRQSMALGIDESLKRTQLRNAAAFWAVADRHPNLRAVAWGHVHQAFDAERAGPHGPVRLLGTPSTCAQFLPRSDDFRMDTRPPAWRWIDLHPDGSLSTAVEWVA